MFIAGVNEGVLPHAMALNVQSQDDYEAACGEERRLMYVGMTRAKRKLHVTWSLYTSASLYRRQNTPFAVLERDTGRACEGSRIRPRSRTRSSAAGRVFFEFRHRG